MWLCGASSCRWLLPLVRMCSGGVHSTPFTCPRIVCSERADADSVAPASGMHESTHMPHLCAYSWLPIAAKDWQQAAKTESAQRIWYSLSKFSCGSDRHCRHPVHAPCGSADVYTCPRAS